MKRKTIIIIISVAIGIMALVGFLVLIRMYMINTLKNIRPQDNIYTKSFGSYKVADGWIESKAYSTNNKFFYIKSEDEKKSTPNNISINESKSRYALSDHETFRIAVLNSISMQMGTREDVTINANGSYTDNGYMLYTFIIYEEDEDITTVQYYILEDYKFVIIQETAFGDTTEIDEVAKEMVNTFKWKE